MTSASKIRRASSRFAAAPCDLRFRQGPGRRRFLHSELLPGRRSWADWAAVLASARKTS